MPEATLILLAISLILFFGLFAEFIFKKTYIPDVLLLIILGFVLGPHLFGVIRPEHLILVAPVFTTFALFFLLYDGAYNIDLASFATGLTKSLGITLFNFITSSLAVLLVMLLFGYDTLTSLLVAFMLGGISSAFVIPVLKQLKVKADTYSILTLESAITDVFCIVLSLSILEIISLQVFDFKNMIGSITTFFAVAGLIGIIAGVIWIIIVLGVFKKNKSYMITIAYVILVYVVTDFLGGNGAIACLFLGLVLRNSDQLISIFNGIIKKKNAKDGEKQDLYEAVAVTSSVEKDFYNQISFFLKTFFFVYIGILINFTDYFALLVGFTIALVIMGTRELNRYITKRYDTFDKSLIKSIFARGLAAAAIAQFAILEGIPNAEVIANIAYVVIGFTIVFSSIRIYMLKKLVLVDMDKVKKTVKN